MERILLSLLICLPIASCGGSLSENGDYWLELRNSFGEWEKTVLITGYIDDYEACNEFLAAITDWNEKNAIIERVYRCTPA